MYTTSVDIYQCVYLVITNYCSFISLFLTDFFLRNEIVNFEVVYTTST